MAAYYQRMLELVEALLYCDIVDLHLFYYLKEQTNAGSCVVVFSSVSHSSLDDFPTVTLNGGEQGYHRGVHLRWTCCDHHQGFAHSTA